MTCSPPAKLNIGTWNKKEMQIPERQEKIPVLKPDWKDRMGYRGKPPIKNQSESSIETAYSQNQTKIEPSSIIDEKLINEGKLQDEPSEN